MSDLPPLDLRLVPFGPEHIADLDAITADPEVLRFTRVPEPVPDGFGAQWLASYEEGRRDGRKEGCAIIGPGTPGRSSSSRPDAFLGIAVAPSIDQQARTIELGYVVAPHARGRGVASAALDLLTTWALHELGMMRLELLIGAENAGSQAVARRCGYTYEGTLRSAYMKPGRREDTQVWSLLPSDPRPAR
jgi:RimJ/RimL family protein N-acetyltransferase